MNLKQLKHFVDQTFELYPRDAENLEVVIVTYNPNHVGGSPFVKVKCAGKGIDWDKSKFQIFPEINLEESLDDEDF